MVRRREMDTRSLRLVREGRALWRPDVVFRRKDRMGKRVVEKRGGIERCGREGERGRGMERVEEERGERLNKRESKEMWRLKKRKRDR